jgi:hypothetical protein
MAGAHVAAPSVHLARIGVCPRCDYEGQGLTYFTRGAHLAALIGATLLTLPWALGAGGFLYYGLRHDHRVCPRCGEGWGRHAERALAEARQGRPRRRRAHAAPHVPSAEGGARAGSVLLLVLAAILLIVGLTELEPLLIGLSVASTAGGALLHRSANRAREERRAALLSSMQLPVLRLAAARHGRLTVTEVAAELEWSLRRAERVLQSLDDGWRVSSEVTDEGVIVYEFRELMLGRSSDGAA